MAAILDMKISIFYNLTEVIHQWSESFFKVRLYEINQILPGM